MRGDEPALLATNRSYRYGDGLFETMKLQNGQLLLAQYHFERLWESLDLLKFEIPPLFTAEKMQQEILHLCKRNECEKLARIRLSVFRGDGGLYDENTSLQYLIECWPLNDSVNRMNENGLVIDIYPHAKKSCDIFSNLKSANFLPYTMAANYAKENKLNDCLVLNMHGRICDATIANLFIIKNKSIITPSLDEGCIKGIVRRRILDFRFQISDFGLHLKELPVTTADLMEADEVFLTNSIHGIRWVRQCRDKIYSNPRTIEIYKHFVQTIAE